MLETLQNLVEQYGYWAVVLGCVVEGEISVLLGAVAVNEGLLKLGGLMTAAFTGTMISDIGFYMAGRHFGRPALARRSRRWRARARMAERLLARYGTPAIVGFRFVFGLRSVAPFVFGMINVRPVRFVVLSSIGAALWAVGFSLLGLLFANALTAVITHIKQVEIGLLVLLLLASLIAAIVYVLRSRRLI